MSNSPLLAVDELRVEFPGRRTSVVAVDGLSLRLERGQTVGLVGESGCGKSVTASAILGLIPEPGRQTAGSIAFEGRDLGALAPAERRALRGGAIALILQDPLAALNPVHPIGGQVAEAVMLHRKQPRRQAWQTAVDALGHVGIPAPRQRAHDYPHQLSGGQRQRVIIAMAMACEPRLLIADEPTTALDVSVQAQVLELLRRLQAELRMGLLLITHDLGVVAQMVDRVTVMQAGRAVEESDVRSLYAAPREAYTKALLAAVPRLDRPRRTEPAHA